MLINSKMPKGVYLLDKEHLPLKPDFEDNTIVMTAEDPTSLEAQEKRQKAKAEEATKMPSAEEASLVFLKSNQDQLGYLIQATLRIEKGLATMNTILRHTLLPKSGDHKMFRGHSINLLQMFDLP